MMRGQPRVYIVRDFRDLNGYFMPPVHTSGGRRMSSEHDTIDQAPTGRLH
jgi:hypothetical protein